MANTGWQGGTVNPSKLEYKNQRIKIVFGGVKEYMNTAALGSSTNSAEINWNGETAIYIPPVVINNYNKPSGSSGGGSSCTCNGGCSGCQGPT